MDQIVPLLVALALIVVAWKVLKGLVKTVALLVLVAAATWFVYGSGVMA